MICEPFKRKLSPLPPVLRLTLPEVESGLLCQQMTLTALNHFGPVVKSVRRPLGRIPASVQLESPSATQLCGQGKVDDTTPLFRWPLVPSGP